jgi:hypothetical protein
MPEHLRALLVILILASAVFIIARRPATDLIASQDFIRRRNLWFALTIVAFLSHNFWVYAGIAGLMLFIALRQEQNKMALFFFLLFLIPNIPSQVPGLGVINYLFELNHVRLLTLLVLLPAFIFLLQRGDTLAYGQTWADKLFTAFMLLSVALMVRDDNVTGLLRNSFYLFTDMLLPYYVASRALKTHQAFKDALLAFVLAATVLAAFAVFEFARHWLLFSSLLAAMDISWGYSSYLGRAGMLRAQATAGHAIALGYVMAVALGFYLYLTALDAICWGSFCFRD